MLHIYIYYFREQYLLTIAWLQHDSMTDYITWDVTVCYVWYGTDIQIPKIWCWVHIKFTNFGVAIPAAMRIPESRDLITNDVLAAWALARTLSGEFTSSFAGLWGPISSEKRVDGNLVYEYVFPEGRPQFEGVGQV